MKQQIINSLSTLILSLIPLLIYSQKNTTYLASKLGYDFASKASDCKTFVIGNYIYGFSDGGGNYISGLKDVKVVDFGGKEVDKGKFQDYQIQFIFGKDHNKFSNLFRIKDEDGKIGVINGCGDIILAPKFVHINGFNDKGQAIAFLNDTIQVIDSNGNIILTENYFFKTNYEELFTIPTPGKINYFEVIDNLLICSKDGIKYGVIDVKTNIIHIPFIYDKIDTEIFISGKDTLGYRVYKGELSTLVDYKTGEEIAPFLFNEVVDLLSFNDKKYILGFDTLYAYNAKRKTKIREDWYNYYNLKENKFVFSKNIHIHKASPINVSHWEVESWNYHLPNEERSSSTSHFIYCISNNSIVSKIVMGKDGWNLWRPIKKLTKNLVLISEKSGETILFDISKKTILMEFSGQPTSNCFVLKNNEKEAEFFTISTKYGYHSLYNENFEPIFKDVKSFSFYPQGDRLIVGEYNGKKQGTTAIDINGNFIGKRYKYKL